MLLPPKHDMHVFPPPFLLSLVRDPSVVYSSQWEGVWSPLCGLLDGLEANEALKGASLSPTPVAGNDAVTANFFLFWPEQGVFTPPGGRRMWEYVFQWNVKLLAKQCHFDLVRPPPSSTCASSPQATVRLRVVWLTETAKCSNVC